MHGIRLVLLLAPLTLSAHTVTIHSDRAEAAPTEQGYQFTHYGKVRAKSTSIGSLTSNRLTCHLEKENESLFCSHFIAFNVTLRHKHGILTAQQVTVYPRKNLCHAQGSVRAITHTDKGVRVRTDADCATLNLKTYSLHTNHHAEPVTLRIESANDESSSEPRSHARRATQPEHAH